MEEPVLHDEWSIQWDGEPKMGGGFHVVGLGTRWPNESEARHAAEVLSPHHANLRIMHRIASDWEIVT